MKILLLLGDNRKYLTHKIFKTEQEMDLFIDKIDPLIMANIDKIESLQKRLDIVKDDYFIYAGAVTELEIIDID